METEQVSETLVFDPVLTWLKAEVQSCELKRCESFRYHKCITAAPQWLTAQFMYAKREMPDNAAARNRQTYHT